MPSFKFIHAADLHLDSPLTGLASKSVEYARRIDDASRSALISLVQLAIDEECSFLLIAGDLFDGQWKDYRTGVFFAKQMSLLRQAGIKVFIILGNHDAENKFASKLELTDNVTLLSTKAAQTVHVDGADAAIHGQSFPQRDVTNNMAASYPAPIEGKYNIGMLHTALDGRDGHALYAPCSVEQLRNHGYHYWALGHVHDYGLQLGSDNAKNDGAHIVFAGVLQGRHIRETGPKGAVLVTVIDGETHSVEFKPLDSVRWFSLTLNLADIEDMAALHICIRELLQTTVNEAEGRALAVRLNLTGKSSLHNYLIADQNGLREQMELLAAGLSGEIWFEKIRIKTEPATYVDTIEADLADPGIVGGIRKHILAQLEDPTYQTQISKIIDEIKTKMPAGSYDDAFIAELVGESASNAREIAFAILDSGLEHGA